jgi:hypothetical protein
MVRGAFLLAIACGCGRIGFQDRTGDGGTLDGTGDGVVPAAACPSFASFCDGFESGNLDAWSSSSVTASTLTAQSSVVHSGHYALKSVGQPPTTFAAMAEHSFPTQTSGTIAAREWVYAPQPLVQWDGLLGVDSGIANGYQYVTVSGADNNMWDATEGDSSSVLGDHRSPTPIVQSTWVCVELDVTLATTGSTLVVYVADQEVVMTSVLNPSPAYNVLASGLAATGATGNGGTVYVDDVVMAAQHIGCQ